LLHKREFDGYVLLPSEEKAAPSLEPVLHD
jgi:hypothetical protein